MLYFTKSIFQKDKYVFEDMDESIYFKIADIFSKTDKIPIEKKISENGNFLGYFLTYDGEDVAKILYLKEKNINIDAIDFENKELIEELRGHVNVEMSKKEVENYIKKFCKENDYKIVTNNNNLIEIINYSKPYSYEDIKEYKKLKDTGEHEDFNVHGISLSFIKKAKEKRETLGKIESIKRVRKGTKLSSLRLNEIKDGWMVKVKSDDIYMMLNENFINETECLDSKVYYNNDLSKKRFIPDDYEIVEVLKPIKNMNLSEMFEVNRDFFKKYTK